MMHPSLSRVRRHLGWRRLPAVVLVLALLAVGAAVTRPATASATGFSGSTFRNPVKYTEGQDPFMTYYNGNYYELTTGSWASGTMSVKARISPSVTGLGGAASTVLWTDSTSSRCCNMWAPEMFLVGGHWYIYYAASGSACCNDERIYVLQSATSDPLSAYTFKARLYDPNNDFWAIDPDLLQKSDGSLYLLWAGYPNGGGTTQENVYIASMSNPYTLSSGRVQLTSPQYSWEGQGNNINEGPTTIQHGGKTFLTYSASGCWTASYSLGELTNTDGNYLNPGSWTKATSPVFSSANGAYGPGHNGFFKSPDGTQDWIIYHAVTNPGGSCGGDRTSRMQKVSFDGSGNLQLGSPVSLNTDLNLPSGDPGASTGRRMFYDDFEDGYSDAWSPSGGSWSVCQTPGDTKALCKTSTDDQYATAGNTGWSDYTLDSWFNLLNLNGSADLYARWQDPNNFYVLQLRQNYDSPYETVYMMWKVVNGSWTRLAIGDVSFNANTWYEMRFSLNGNQLSGAFYDRSNWHQFATVTDGTFSRGKIAVRSWNSAARWDLISVTAN